MLSFKQFMTVDYTPGMPDLVSYAAHKRHRGRIGEETTDEALDYQARRARARSMKKNKAKIAMGRRRAAKKMATGNRLQKRANKAARTQMFNKLSKGKTKEEMPFARRQEIEKRIDKMKGRVDKIARKLVKDKRQLEKDRRSSK